MTASKQVSRLAGRKRYPGARPFSDSPEDQQIFFGRDADIDRLFERVLGTQLLVLFGKSGLGKTSLLTAGLFPKLRKEKPLLPVPIRVNGPGSPAEIVIAAVTESCTRVGAQITPGDTAGIWEFLRTSLIWSGDLLLTPVLVFDQFEEIFTLRDAQFRMSLATELGALASGIPPERLHSVEGTRSERGARLGEQPPQVKILLSLRDDYLGTLQELSAAIPGLFQERYRLAPLAEEDARLAIVNPAARVAGPQDIPFTTPCFEYDEEALSDLLAFLQGKSRFIEPFQLQLLCSHAEEIVAARAADTLASVAKLADRPVASATQASNEAPPAIRITRADLGGARGMERVLRQFYGRVIAMLDWNDRRRARRLCEEGLLSASGNRLMLDQTQIESDYRVTPAALTTLVKEYLLRREQRLDSLFYEISHDRLAESIQHSRKLRLPKNLRQMLAGAATVALITIVALFWWNHKINQARSDAEDLVSFLVGESLLEKLRPVGRNDILEEVQSEVAAYLDKAPDPDQPGQQRIRALALRSSAEILQSKGRLDDAIAKLQEAAQVFGDLAAKATADASMKREQARVLYILAGFLLDQGKVRQAHDSALKGLELRKQLYSDGDRGVELSIDLADSNSSVGYILNKMGKPREALEYIEQALKLLRPLEATTSRSARLFMARHNAVDNLAASLGLVGEAQAGRDAYAEAAKITDEWLRHHPLSADARLRNAIAAARQANLQMAKGAAEAALVQYEQIHQASDELVRWDETNASWRRNLAETLVLVGIGQHANRQYDKATQSYNDALKIFEELAQTDQTDRSLATDLSWAYESRGLMALQRKQWKQAIEDLSTSERYIAAAAQAETAYVDWQWSWASVHFHLARAHSGEGPSAKAIEHFRRARLMTAELIKAAPEMTFLRGELANITDFEVVALERSGRMDEAAALARQKTQALAGALAADPKNPILLNQAYLDDIRIGDLAKAAGRLDAAVAAYRRGLQKIARATELEPDNVTWRDNLQTCHTRIGDALYDSKRWAEAEGAYRRGATAAETAFATASHRADPANRVFLARIKIGDALSAANKPESALNEFERARVWIDKAIEAAPGESVFVDNLGILEQRIGTAKQALGDAKGAETAFRTSIEQTSRSVKIATENEAASAQANRNNRLHLAHEALAEFLESRGDTAGALTAHGRALDGLRRATELDPKDATYRDNMRVVYVHSARLKEKSRDTGGAEADLRAAVEAGQQAADLGNSAQYAYRASLAPTVLGGFYERADSPDKALPAYELASRSADLAARLDPGNELYFWKSSDVRRKVGHWREESGAAEEARADFEAAVEAARRAVELASNDGQNWQALYLAQWFLAANIERERGPSVALPLLQDALKSAEQAARLLPQDSTIREHTATLRTWVTERSR